MNDLLRENLLEILDKAGLTEEICRKSKKLRQVRTILINKYIYEMSREETCAELDFISLRTYNNRLSDGLNRIRKYL
jgi:DNA-directed RNA polymerase specialized sigma24 family protein